MSLPCALKTPNAKSRLPEQSHGIARRSCLLVCVFLRHTFEATSCGLRTVPA
jgi:hypothetical protein